MKRFLLRLPAQILQSACLFTVVFCVLRVLERIPFIVFSAETVLGCLAYVLSAAAFMYAVRRTTGYGTLAGMFLVACAAFFIFLEDMRDQAVWLFQWANGALSGRPRVAKESTLLVLTLTLILVLTFRLFTSFRGTALVLLALYIAYVIAMPRAKIAVSAADVMPGAAAILLLFFAAQLGAAAETEQAVRSTLKIAGKRKKKGAGETESGKREKRAGTPVGESLFRFGQKKKIVRGTRTASLRRQARYLVCVCALAAAAIAIALPAANRLTKRESARVRRTASDIEHQVRSALATAGGSAYDTPVIDGQVGHQLNRYTGAEQFSATVDQEPVEDLYLKGFTGGQYKDGVWAPAHEAETFQAMADDLQIPQRTDVWIWLVLHSYAGTPYGGGLEDVLEAAQQPFSGVDLMTLFPKIFAPLNEVAATGNPSEFRMTDDSSSRGGMYLQYIDKDMAYYEVYEPGFEADYTSDYVMLPFDSVTGEGEDTIVSTLYFYDGQIYHRDLRGNLHYVSGGDGPILQLEEDYSSPPEVSPIEPTDLLLQKAGGREGEETPDLPQLSPYLPAAMNGDTIYIGDTPYDVGALDGSRTESLTAFLPRSETPGTEQWLGIESCGDIITNACAMRDYYQEHGLEQYLEVPDSLPRLKEYVAENPLTDPVDITAFIRYTLDTHASYSLAAGDPNDGTDPVEYFLFDSHRGYCEQYASAAVMMYRLYGIPARYAAGYRIGTGEFKPGIGANTYTAAVPDRDAHAWVEIFLPTVGWTPVEMTVTGEMNPDTLVYPGFTEGYLSYLRSLKGWVITAASAVDSEDEEPDQNNINPSASQQAAGGQTPAANINQQKQGLSEETVRLVRTLMILALCALAAVLFVLMLQKYYRTRRPAKVGRAFELRFRKKGLRIESRDFAARAAAAFPGISEGEFAAFRSVVLSDSYDAAAGKDEAEMVRALYRKLRKQKRPAK